MARFKRGDTVTVNGETATLSSWPSNDEGPFRYTAEDKRTKIPVQKMAWASKSDVMPSGETLGRTDITESAALVKADVKLVKAGPEIAKKQGREIPLDLQQELEADKKREAAEAAKDLVIENLKAELEALRAGAATAGVLLTSPPAETPALEPGEIVAGTTMDGRLITTFVDDEPSANDLLMAEPRDGLPPAMPRGWGRAAGT